MKNTHYYIILLLPLLSIDCQSSSGVVVPEKVSQLAESQLGSPCEFIYNSHRTHVLAYSSQSNQVAGRTKFLVLRIDNGEVIESGSFRPGYIKWINGDIIEYLDAPEVIGLDDSLDNYKKTVAIK